MAGREISSKRKLENRKRNIIPTLHLEKDHRGVLCTTPQIEGQVGGKECDELIKSW
jgi:hypothetical protein